MKKSLITILIVSLLALTAAFGAEFMYHVNPCILCLAQRVPYVLVIILSAVALGFPKSARGILIAVAVLFFMNFAIADYQIGIERGWWGLDEIGNSQICTANNLSMQNVKDLYASMTGTPVGDCAHPSFNFHGLTFAVMNAALSLALLMFALRAARRN